MIRGIFILPRLWIQETLNSFQLKLSHRITATDSFLFKCGLKETELCTFCTETKLSLLHLFWECIYSKNFWFLFVNVLKSCGLSMQYINAPNVILRITNPLDPDNTNNQVILILKYYLYKCWWLVLCNSWNILSK